MVNFTSLAATATRLITENGRDMVLVKSSRDPIDPDKPWRGNDVGGETEIPTIVAMTRWKQEEINGTTIKAGDKKGWVFPISGQEIETFNFVDDGAIRWGILAVKIIKPATIIVAYRLHLRNE